MKKKKENKHKRKKTHSNGKYIYLKENDIFLLSANFKPTSKEKKIQK
jgi:hypothetical protein